MPVEVNRLKKYLQHTLGVEVAVTPWETQEQLPFFLREKYRFYTALFLKAQCLLMVAQDDFEDSAGVVSKHYDHLLRKCNYPVVYVCNSLDSHIRQRLIGHKIPFIVPDNQMYLPMLGIDLREIFRNTILKRNRFKPSTQAVLIYALLEHENMLIPTKLSQRLGYSVMSMSRSLNELEEIELGESNMYGKERCLTFFEHGRAIWEKALPYLQSPVYSSHKIRSCEHYFKHAVRSGLSALADYSMLNLPKTEAIALSSKDWKSLKKEERIEELHYEDDSVLLIESWKYSPSLLKNKNIVDPLSLYLSLQNTHDERVEEALEHLIRGIEW